MRGTLSIFSPKFAKIIVYMLQSTEYQAVPYLRWFWRTVDFGQVMKRRDLEYTKVARLMLLALRCGIAAQVSLGLIMLWLGLVRGVGGAWPLGAALIVAYPVVWAHMIVVPLVLGDWLVIRPKNRKLVQQSGRIFANHPGVKIAVAGSYGKTTMKELLGTVLSEGKKVAITPANKNVASSHAMFAIGLDGDEDVLVVEFGEGRPGDVEGFSKTIQPNIGVITGIAPAHLDQYPSLDAAAQDIFSLANYLHDDNMYVNAESSTAQKYLKDTHIAYSHQGVGDWKVSDVHVDFAGIRFRMTKKGKSLQLKSGLLGRHQVGPLAAVVAIADFIGLSAKQIEDGVAKTTSFEHRMHARSLRGAWIIDDTYNGNIDGIQAGLALLSELPAKRKIYVTPGLVDQGVETGQVHVKMGELIASTNPDKVVLMKNSVTTYILRGLESKGYKKEVVIEANPLEYYTNLEHFIAAGDVVLMQNDWTDNYQ